MGGPTVRIQTGVGELWETFGRGQGWRIAEGDVLGLPRRVINPDAGCYRPLRNEGQGSWRTGIERVSRLVTGLEPQRLVGYRDRGVLYETGGRDGDGPQGVARETPKLVLRGG